MDDNYEYLRNGACVSLFGHSLGGALATLAAPAIAALLPTPVQIVVSTVGAPRVLNHAARKAYERLDSICFRRYVLADDVVPTLPPRVFGFRHIGFRQQLNAADTLLPVVGWEARLERICERFFCFNIVHFIRFRWCAHDIATYQNAFLRQEGAKFAPPERAQTGPDCTCQQETTLQSCNILLWILILGTCPFVWWSFRSCLLLVETFYRACKKEKHNSCHPPSPSSRGISSPMRKTSLTPLQGTLNTGLREEEGAGRACHWRRPRHELPAQSDGRHESRHRPVPDVCGKRLTSLSYPQLIGSSWSPRAGGMIRLSGGAVVIRMAKDWPLAVDQAVGTAGTFSVQLAVTLLNPDSASITPHLYIAAIHSGVIESAKGQSCVITALGAHVSEHGVGGRSFRAACNSSGP